MKQEHSYLILMFMCLNFIIIQGKNYKVTIRTGTETGSGYSNSVYVTLYGQSGTTSQTSLPGYPIHDDFEQDQIDNYLMTFNIDVGNLEKMKLTSQADGNNWYVDYVRVKDVSRNVLYSFILNNWLTNSAPSITVDVDKSYNLGGSLHTVLRAAQKIPGSPKIYDLWIGDNSIPTINDVLTPQHFSIEDSEKELLKSPLVECMMSRVTWVNFEFYADGARKLYYTFNSDSDNKTSWFSKYNLLDTSFTLLGPFIAFSAAGFPCCDRHWALFTGDGGCANDVGWSLVSDNTEAVACTFDKYTEDHPLFLYSSSSGKDHFLSQLYAETFFIKFHINDTDLGGNCVSSCVNLADGRYQSCFGCDVYVSCSGYNLTYSTCPSEMKFDNLMKRCVDISTTCHGNNAPDACRPNIQTTQDPLLLILCVCVLYGCKWLPQFCLYLWSNNGKGTIYILSLKVLVKPVYCDFIKNHAVKLVDGRPIIEMTKKC